LSVEKDAISLPLLVIPNAWSPVLAAALLPADPTASAATAVTVVTAAPHFLILPCIGFFPFLPLARLRDS
jgi:hypothetical protein